MAKGKGDRATTAVDERTPVFVSYSRRDEAFVQQLQSMLQQMELDVWLDLEDIPPSTNWSEEIQDGIERCEALIVVVSPDSTDSLEVGKEIQRADELGKRIIPVVHRRVEPSAAHPAVAARNWVWWLSTEQTDEALAQIDRSLKIDPEWTKEHTRLNGLALTWERRGKNKNMLIRGDDLKTAEQEIVIDRGPEQPQVTEQIRQFVAESRRIESRRQRRLVTTALTVAVVSIALAVVALLARAEADRQRAEAVVQRDTATSAALAARSETRLVNEPDLAALLALESYRTKDTVDALGSLLRIVDSPTTFVERSEAHDAPVSAIARDRDFGLAATGDEEGGVVIWELSADGAIPTGEFEVGGGVSALAFDEATGEITVAVDGAPVEVWTASGEPEQVDVGTYPSYVALSSDGRTGAGLATSDDGEVNVVVGDVFLDDPTVEASLGLEIDELPEGIEPTALAISEDSTLVAFGFGTLLFVLPTDGSEGVAAVDIETLDGIVDPERSSLDVESVTFVGADRLAFGIDEGHVYLVELEANGTAVPVEPLPASAARSLSSLTALDEDGGEFELIGSAHNNGEIKLWVVDGVDAFEFATMKGHDEEALAVSVDADGAVMSGSWDGNVIFSQAFAQAQIGDPLIEDDAETSHDTDVIDVEFIGPDLLASLDISGSVKSWDPNEGRIIEADVGEGVTTIDAVEGRIVTGDETGAVTMFDTSDGSPIEFEPIHEAPVSQVAISGDGQMAVSADESGTTWLWDVGGERLAEVDTPTGFAVNAFAFPSREVLWLGGANDDDVTESVAVRVDTETGAITESARHNPDETGHFVESIALSPDGSTLATGGTDRRIFVYDTRDLSAEPRELAAHLETVDDMVFFGNDALLAADLDGSILMWDVPDGRVVGELSGPADGVNALGLHPDGDLLVAGSEDDTVWVWELRPDRWVEGACRLAGRNMTDAEWASLQLDDEPVAHCPDEAGGDGRPPADYPIFDLTDES